MAESNEFRVVRITNISNFDFTGELGARYHGADFEIRAGESKLMPYPLGNHLAKHLARQILMKKAPIRDATETDGKGSDRPLWDDKVIEELKAKIMTDAYTEEKPRAMTEGERMAAKVADLNKLEEQNEKDNSGGNAPFEGTPTDGTSGEIVYQDKQQVIAALEKKGIKYDPRSTKAVLETFLK